MRVSDIVFAAHLVPYKMRKTQRPITSYFDREIKAVTQMDYGVKVFPKRSYFGAIILTPF